MIGLVLVHHQDHVQDLDEEEDLTLIRLEAAEVEVEVVDRVVDRVVALVVEVEDVEALQAHDQGRRLVQDRRVDKDPGLGQSQIRLLA